LHHAFGSGHRLPTGRSRTRAATGCKRRCGEPHALDRISEPRVDRTSGLAPAVLSQQAIEPGGQHVHAIIRLAPAICWIASNAEGFADQLVQCLHQIFIQQTVEGVVAPARIVLAHDLHDQIIACQHRERSLGSGTVHDNGRVQHFVRSNPYRGGRVVVRSLQEGLSLHFDAVRLRELQQDDSMVGSKVRPVSFCCHVMTSKLFKARRTSALRAAKSAPRRSARNSRASSAVRTVSIVASLPLENSTHKVGPSRPKPSSVADFHSAAMSFLTDCGMRAPNASASCAVPQIQLVAGQWPQESDRVESLRSPHLPLGPIRRGALSKRGASGYCRCGEQQGQVSQKLSTIHVAHSSCRKTGPLERT
jgi:hypothetical protein